MKHKNKLLMGVVCIACVIGGAMAYAIISAPYMVPDKHLAKMFRRWVKKLPKDIPYDSYIDAGTVRFQLQHPAFYMISFDDRETFFKAINGLEESKQIRMHQVT